MRRNCVAVLFNQQAPLNEAFFSAGMLAATTTGVHLLICPSCAEHTLTSFST
jgi:hypothetical protein